jgi:hypothetical protein
LQRRLVRPLFVKAGLELAIARKDYAMIRDGYEDMIDPEFNEKCLADELTSCGMSLPHLYSANNGESDLSPAMSLEFEPAVAA